MEQNGELNCWDKDIESLFISLLEDYGEGREIRLFETRSREGIFAPALVPSRRIF